MSKGEKFVVGLVCALALCVIFVGFNVYAAETTIGIIPGENEYHEIFESATEEDYLMLERVVYWEAARANCPMETCVAVVETVLNRVLDSEWPNTISSVCNDNRWGRQFICKYYIPEYWWQDELVSDAISYVLENGRTVLPSCDYQYFATAKQSCAANHIWFGKVKADGSPDKGKNYCHGMYFGEKK